MSDTNNQPTIEQLQASFAQAQRKITQMGQQMARLKAEKTQPPAPKPQEKAPDVSFLDSLGGTPGSGLDADSLQQEFLANNGALTPATKQKLVASGLNADLIQTMEQAFRIKVAQQTAQAAQILGSQEQLNKFVAWAKTLPQNKKNELNRGLRGDAWEQTLRGFNQARLGTNKSNEPVNKGQQARTNAPAFSASNLGEPSPQLAFANPPAMNQALQHPDYKSNKDGYRDKMQLQILSTHRYGYADYR